MTFDLLTKPKKSSIKMKSPQFTSFTPFFSLWTVFLSAHSLCFSRTLWFPSHWASPSGHLLFLGSLHSSMNVWVDLDFLHPIMLTVSQVTVFNWEQSRASLLMQLDKESTCSLLLLVSHVIVLAVDPQCHCCSKLSSPALLSLTIPQHTPWFPQLC